MVTLTIAMRSLLRRKVRMLLIGLLVVLGTILIVFGETFSLSAKHFSRLAIVNYFTGDLIIYSDRAKDNPSPFSFTTPLFGVLLSALLLREPVTPELGIGVACVAFGIYLANRRI